MSLDPDGYAGVNYNFESQAGAPTIAELQAALEVCRRVTKGPLQPNSLGKNADGIERAILWQEDSLIKNRHNWIAEVRGQANIDFFVLARTLLPRCLNALLERAAEVEKLRKILAFVPARVYIAAKESAGYGDEVKASTSKLLRDIDAARKEGT